MREPSSRRMLIYISLAAASAFTLACSKNPAASDEGQPEGNVVAEVTVIRVERADISSTLTVTGTVAAPPNEDVKVSSLVSGRVASMMVAEGDRVGQGQVLAKIDDQPFRNQLQQAEAAVEQAKANLENARLNRDRNENLFNRGIAARKDLEDARTQVSVNEAALRQAEASLALARLQLSRTEVRSPLEGTVVKRLLSAGEQVDGSASQPIFEVANLSQAELFGNVPAVYLSKIHTGTTLPVTADAFPGRTFNGRVVAISPAVDPASNVGLVRIRIHNESRLLRLGMFLTAQLPLEKHARVLVVPTQAIYRDEEGKPRIYRVKGERAEALPVTVGIEAQGHTELLSGAAEGETVVLTGGYGLPEHSTVRVKP